MIDHIVLEAHEQSGSLIWKRKVRRGQRVTIGRTLQADFSFANDGKMSSRHFVIDVENEQCLVSDMNSTNGTFLNGSRIQASPINHEDQVTAGQTKFTFYIHHVEPKFGSPPPPVRDDAPLIIDTGRVPQSASSTRSNQDQDWHVASSKAMESTSGDASARPSEPATDRPRNEPVPTPPLDHPISPPPEKGGPIDWGSATHQKSRIPDRTPKEPARNEPPPRQFDSAQDHSLEKVEPIQDSGSVEPPSHAGTPAPAGMPHGIAENRNRNAAGPISFSGETTRAPRINVAEPSSVRIRVIAGVAAQYEQLLNFGERGESKIVVGRGSEADWEFTKDTQLSRKHFEIELVGSQAILRDLESRNGTFLNDRRITVQNLKHHDQIRAGETVFMVDFVT
jgi:pSer/pThr/pTyr-binding forkhead associated (FHA) protein